MRIALALAAALLCACGGPSECKLDDPKSCSTGQVCEAVTGRAKPLCFKPVQVKGTVTSQADGKPVSGAEVIATDELGIPAGTKATSASDGTYVLPVPSTRSDEKGTVAGRKVLLRASAQDFESFPGSVRVSLPIDTSAATHNPSDGPWLVQGPLTGISLVPVADIKKNRPGIIGSVSLPANTTALVVAEGTETFTALADQSGDFHLFNIAPGHYTVQAYTKGFNFTAATVDVVSSDVTGVSIAQAGTASTQVPGKVQLVAGADNAGTSVVLAVESTFVSALGRGEVPPGLRTPDFGIAPDISGDFTLHGVPDGKYVLLAAFENDNNVRDPDPNIAGTQIPHLTVTNGAVTPSGISIKVTGAILMNGPGADGTVEPVSSTVTFGWHAYPSASTYAVQVYNSTGTKVWEQQSVSGTTVQYNGPALTSGQVYQWRATAYGNNSNPISTTEELRGLFAP